MKRALGMLVTGVALLFLVAGPSAAAPPQPQPLTCGSLGEIMILVGPANGTDASFGAARVVGGGHLIPVDFRFSAFDETAGVELFDSGLIAKGGGNGNHTQQTTTCSSTETATLGDFLDPGETPPPGTAVTDVVTFTITATVVVK